MKRLYFGLTIRQLRHSQGFINVESYRVADAGLDQHDSFVLDLEVLQVYENDDVVETSGRNKLVTSYQSFEIILYVLC